MQVPGPQPMLTSSSPLAPFLSRPPAVLAPVSRLHWSPVPSCRQERARVRVRADCDKAREVRGT